MAEENAHALQKAYLDQHEAHTDQRKIERAVSHQSRASRRDRAAQRNDQHGNNENQCDREKQEQGDGGNEITAPHTASFGSLREHAAREGQRLQRSRQRQLIEKERPLIGWGCQVELQAAGEGLERSPIRRVDDALERSEEHTSELQSQSNL